MRPRPAWLAAVVGAALLAACATLPSAEDGLDLETRRGRLDSIAAWDLRGRLVVDTGERAFQARYRWSQNGSALKLTVNGLFGAGGFEIEGDPNRLTLRSRRDERRLLDPEFELSALFGWWLPVTSLPDWLRGLPDPAYPAESRFGTAGTLVTIRQRLWRIEFEEYQLVNDVVVPSRLQLEHESLQIRVTVDRFEPIATSEIALN